MQHQQLQRFHLPEPSQGTAEPPIARTPNLRQAALPSMAQRCRSSVASVVTAEPEMSSPPYATRNKRRKLLHESNSPPPRNQPSKVFQPPLSQKIPDKVIRVLPHIRQTPVYSRNLDKALKSILSENPRMRSSGGGEDIGVETVEVTPSADEEGSSGIVVSARGKGRPSSLSISSQQSRETSPSSTLDSAALADIAPFIEFFQREKEQGGVSKEVKDEAMNVLREWREEWMSEEKRIRELKRKIKARNAMQSEPPPTPPTPEVKSRGRTKLDRPSVESNPKSVESSKATSPGAKESARSPSQGSNPENKKEIVAGPNGLTGNYWTTMESEMGRGNRRKSKTHV